MLFLQHFINILFEFVLSKIVFLSSDGASVNSGKDSELIRLLQEDFPWISFIWCFSHWLELALKDALKEFIEPVDTSLIHSFYLYKKSSKKHQELKNFIYIIYWKVNLKGQIAAINPNSTNVYKSSLSEKYEIQTTLWILIMPEIVFWKVLKLP